MIEGEIENHPSHPWHKLKMVNMERPFTCDGCLELGFGYCYTCTDSSTACNFHLHIDCARAWYEVTIAHPFFPELYFHFHRKGRPNCYCDACGRAINGYAYYCAERGYDLHPCCAKLPLVYARGSGRKFGMLKVLKIVRTFAFIAVGIADPTDIVDLVTSLATDD